MLKRNPPHSIGRKRNTRYTRYILASLQPPVNMSDDHPSVTQGILLEWTLSSTPISGILEWSFSTPRIQIQI